MATSRTYPPPLDRLLELGIDETDAPADVDYTALGIMPEHVTALIAIATDRHFDTAPVPEAWAPLHAWRALGRLRAADAVEPLVTLFDRAADDDDWILDDLPHALGEIGAPAIPALVRYLASREHPEWSRVAAADALVHVGNAYPDLRDACGAALTHQLRHFQAQGAELNALLVSSLLDLKAVESAPAIQEAFMADSIDLSVTGDWEDAQVELGLLPERITPARRYRSPFDRERTAQLAPKAREKHNRRAAEKRRRKIAKQSKRRNRRRK